jgi:hypothetical protein
LLYVVGGGNPSYIIILCRQDRRHSILTSEINCDDRCSSGRHTVKNVKRRHTQIDSSSFLSSCDSTGRNLVGNAVAFVPTRLEVEPLHKGPGKCVSYSWYIALGCFSANPKQPKRIPTVCTRYSDAVAKGLFKED